MGLARARRRAAMQRLAKGDDILMQIAGSIGRLQKQVAEIQQVLVDKGLVQRRTESGIIVPGQGKEMTK